MELFLPPIDPNGEFFGVMTDFVGHGTSSAASITSKGIQEYDIYNNTNKYSIKGVAPDAKIVPVKALWFGDSVYASLWAAGFDNSENKWKFSGIPRVDIMSNSWGVSNFPSLNSAPGLDILSLIQSVLVTPHSLDPNYPGVVIVSSAGNSGHGYGRLVYLMLPHLEFQLAQQPTMFSLDMVHFKISQDLVIPLIMQTML